jgi:predicted GNAT superfamily acetyltransferase
MFKDYLKERLGREMLESEHGFAIYGFNCLGLDMPHVYIEDIYVTPEKRKSGEAVRLADKIAEMAKSKGIRAMVGSVAIDATGSETSLKVLIAYGMKPLSANNNTIYMCKEIK